MVVTFTNKAAGELKARLFSAITEATSAAQLRLEQRGLQVQLLVPEGPEQLGVLACTFHSWCFRVLRARYRVGMKHALTCWVHSCIEWLEAGRAMEWCVVKSNAMGWCVVGSNAGSP